MKFSVLEPDGGGEESLENYLKLSQVYPADFRLRNEKVPKIELTGYMNRIYV